LPFRLARVAALLRRRAGRLTRHLSPDWTGADGRRFGRSRPPALKRLSGVGRGAPRRLNIFSKVKGTFNNVEDRCGRVRTSADSRGQVRAHF
jgi:hypothetical protein